MAAGAGERTGETIHKPAEVTIQNSIDSKTKEPEVNDNKWQPKVEIKRAGCEATDANSRVVDQITSMGAGQPMLITTNH